MGIAKQLYLSAEDETHSNRFSIHHLARYCLDLAEFMETERVILVDIFLNAGSRQENLA